MYDIIEILTMKYLEQVRWVCGLRYISGPQKIKNKK